MYQHSLGPSELESGFAEKVLTDTKLNMIQQCSPTVKKAKSIPGCIRRNVVSRSNEVMLPLCSALVELHLESPVLGSPVRERHGHTGEKCHRENKEIGASEIREEVERAGISYPGEESEGSYQCV